MSKLLTKKLLEAGTTFVVPPEQYGPLMNAWAGFKSLLDALPEGGYAAGPHYDRGSANKVKAANLALELEQVLADLGDTGDEEPRN